MTREILLTRGLAASVDDADYERFGGLRWHATGGRPYAARAQMDGIRKVGTVFLHRLIMPPPPGFVVDHIDGDSLNNRRANLRVCTHKQNIRNAVSRIGSSRFKGVSYAAQRQKWQAHICVDGRSRSLGRFDEEGAAARAYDSAAHKHFGPFARPNFPPD